MEIHRSQGHIREPQANQGVGPPTCIIRSLFQTKSIIGIIEDTDYFP